MKPKKKLGQHFLIDENISERIANAILIPKQSQNQNLLEIGAGQGALTKYLLKKENYNFKIVEIDADAISYLTENFQGIADKIVNLDVLNLNFREIFDGELNVIGNLPYNITAPIFFQLLDNKDIIPQIVVMIQKEVADRIVSVHGNKVYGILSVLLQSFYKIEYLFTVNEHVFYPPPKVKSAVIRLTRLETQPDIDNFDKFKNVVKAAFNQRRKMLRNALALYDISKVSTEYLTKRAEQLSVIEFHYLYKKITN